ncbi:MAG: methyltransferase domain-containing protein [Tunicatimonas sp.]
MEFPDVLGNAWLDYWQHQTVAPLLLLPSYGSVEEMPVDYFFRPANAFPPLEQYALDLCQGRILDVGAGVGSHALFLQQQGKAVTTLEVSPAGVQIQQARGVKRALQTDYRDYQQGGFDTVLLLMNGIGVVGSLAGLRDFFHRAKTWIAPAGQLLFDSSDIAYLYEDTDRPADGYYGEVRYQYEYRGCSGEWFSWLYVDEVTLQQVAQEAGWQTQIVFQDDQDQYLVRATLRI